MMWLLNICQWLFAAWEVYWVAIGEIWHLPFAYIAIACAAFVTGLLIERNRE